MQIGFTFYYKKVIRTNIDNIPDSIPVLFVSNHQNALIDPLLIGAYTPKEMYYITRAQVFKNPYISKILYSANMLPIYRIRDGYKELNKNTAIFEKCFQIIHDKKSILIFPEGNHSLQRRIRLLGKGFTRIAFGSLEKYPDKDLVIVPVGLNYSDPVAYPSKVNIVYGKPVPVKHYWNDLPENDAIQALTDKVSNELKKLTTHIEGTKDHDHIITYFDKEEFLDPDKVNKKLEHLDQYQPITEQNKKNKGMLYYLIRINSFIPFLIWNNIKPKIEEKEFITTFKFTIAITAFPFFYLLQSILIGYLTSYKIGISYFIVSALLVYINTKTSD
jgi:1-acyl-sn-glycerol-3-phosphate acyltransferase